MSGSRCHRVSRRLRSGNPWTCSPGPAPRASAESITAPDSPCAPISPAFSMSTIIGLEALPLTRASHGLVMLLDEPREVIGSGQRRGPPPTKRTSASSFSRSSGVDRLTWRTNVFMEPPDGLDELNGKSEAKFSTCREMSVNGFGRWRPRGPNAARERAASVPPRTARDGEAGLRLTCRSDGVSYRASALRGGAPARNGRTNDGRFGNHSRQVPPGHVVGADLPRRDHPRNGDHDRSPGEEHGRPPQGPCRNDLPISRIAQADRSRLERGAPSDAPAGRHAAVRRLQLLRDRVPGASASRSWRGTEPGTKASRSTRRVRHRHPAVRVLRPVRGGLPVRRDSHGHGEDSPRRSFEGPSQDPRHRLPDEQPSREASA